MDVRYRGLVLEGGSLIPQSTLLPFANIDGEALKDANLFRSLTAKGLEPPGISSQIHLFIHRHLQAAEVTPYFALGTASRLGLTLDGQRRSDSQAAQPAAATASA